MVNGICKLCLTHQPLCASHIIPELCYGPTYDTKHRATMFKAEPNSKQLIQKGLREYLLCKTCENKISKWENYFKQFWYDTPALPSPLPADGQTFLVKGFDYKLFKLFHLANLWRASVASGEEFNTVKLGCYEEKIRQRLMNEDPGDVNTYPIFAMTLANDKNQPVYGLVSKFQRSKWKLSTAYYVCHSGCEWVIIISERPGLVEQQLLDKGPQLAGTMELEVIPYLQSATIKVFGEQRIAPNHKNLPK